MFVSEPIRQVSVAKAPFFFSGFDIVHLLLYVAPSSRIRATLSVDTYMYVHT